MSQPHHFCRGLFRAKLRLTASVNDEPPRPSQSCGKHVVNYACRWFAQTTSVVSLTIRPLNVITKELSAAPNALSMLFLVPSVICNTWARIITLELALNVHKSDFRLYAAGMINRMANKLLYDHLFCHNIDYFHVCIFRYDSCRQQYWISK